MTALTFYENNLKVCSDTLNVFRKRLLAFSLLRLLSFSVFGLAVYSLISHPSLPLLALSFLGLAFFLTMVVFAQRLKEKKTFYEKLFFINANEKDILQGKPNQMDPGEHFSDGTGYAEDLDIFGVRSLFHLLNRCTTTHGKSYLANLLQHPLLNPQRILDQQTAVRVLSQQSEKRQQITAHGLLHEEGNDNLHSLEDWLKSSQQLRKKKRLLVLRWILPVFNTGSFIYYIATGNILYIAIGFIIAWGINGKYARYVLKEHLSIGKKQGVLNQYAGILKTFASVNTQDSALLHQLSQSAQSAHQEIRLLAKLSSAFDQRLNLVVNILLNSLAIYDIQCILALEKWKERNNSRFAEWLETVGRIECLNSLAGFAFNYPDYTYPVVQTGETIHIEAIQLAHPLIPASVRVPNDFVSREDNKIVLITGSNMSGKTTFLRTLGVNLILGQAGAPVCAARLSFSPVEILTSIRVNDSLQENTSYFMAELKRLQKIIHRLKEKKPSLVLIDEILRGTNSEDKTYGSEQFILQLAQHHCLTFFATHDLTLSALEAGHSSQVINYCFESIIENDTLRFDYKLRPGVARNKNASFLMKQMGIIDKS